MIYDLAELDKLVEDGYVRKQIHPTLPLAIYCYTELTEHEKMWTPLTRVCRGLIVETPTGRRVAKPFEKFFNIGAMPETYIDNLPNLPYIVTNKFDGSMLIIYHYNGEWRTATKGSFTSDQAVKGKEMLNKYNMSNVSSHSTLICEVIYPANRIVVDYKGEEKLVLLAMFHMPTGDEYNRATLEMTSKNTNMQVSPIYDLSIEQMIGLQTSLSQNEEGFVVRYANGLRLKIKGSEYLKMHKLKSELTPLAFWEAMEKGKLPEDMVAQLPDEWASIWRPIKEHLEMSYYEIKNEIQFDLYHLDLKELKTKEDRKALGLYLADPNCPIYHKRAMWGMLDNKPEVVERYVMAQIRPTGNKLAE